MGDAAWWAHRNFRPGDSVAHARQRGKSFEQNRIGQTGVPMLQNVPCFDIVPPNFVCKCLMVHCRRIAPTLFPHEGNNRADDIRPYADVQHCTRCVFCGWLKIFESVGVAHRNFLSVIRRQPARQTFSLLLFTYSTNFCSTAVRTMSLRQVR